MKLISTDNLVIRKALKLSLTEMAVLCDIVQMSQDKRLGNWCVKSKEKMADWFDLSPRTIYTILNSLEEKGYIERSQVGVRPTDFIYELEMCQEEIGVYVRSKNIEIISEKIVRILQGNCNGRSTTLQISQVDSANFANVLIYENNNLVIKGDSQKNESNLEGSQQVGSEAEKQISGKQERPGEALEAKPSKGVRGNPPPSSAPPPPSENFLKFLDWSKANGVERIWKMDSPLTSEQYEKIREEFGLGVKRNLDVFIETVLQMENKKTLLKDYKSTNLTLRNWLTRRKQTDPTLLNPVNNTMPANEKRNISSTVRVYD